MAMAFTRVSWWLLGGGQKDTNHEPTSSAGLPAAASPDFAFRDADNARFPPGQAAKMRSARPRRRWHSREERWRRVDREFDLVLVPSDGGACLSGSDSDDSDWSIGWLEPHAPGFLSDACDGDSEAEGSFAVLVPCYGRGRCVRGGAAAPSPESSSNTDHAIGAMGLFDGHSTERKKYFERWLSSLQSS